MGTPFLAGSGIILTPDAATKQLTIASSGGGFSWAEVTGTSQAMAVESGYVANNAALVTLTLPATAALGEAVAVNGKGAGLWKIAQNSGQTIHFLGQPTTTGVSGEIAAEDQYGCILLRCITDNTDWVVESATGNFVVT